MHSPVVASIGAVISQTLIKSTTTSRAPLLPIRVYRSLILSKRQMTVIMSTSFIRAVAGAQHFNIRHWFINIYQPTLSASSSPPHHLMPALLTSHLAQLAWKHVYSNQEEIHALIHLPTFQNKLQLWMYSRSLSPKSPPPTAGSYSGSTNRRWRPYAAPTGFSQALQAERRRASRLQGLIHPSPVPFRLQSLSLMKCVGAEATLHEPSATVCYR